MNDQPKITGVLRNARRISREEDIRGPCLTGFIYHDAKGRFRDGSRIVTSQIMAEDNDVFVTRFSTYRVESWLGQAANNNTSSANRADSINALVAYFHGKSKAAGWWVDTRTGEDLSKNPYVIGTKLMLCVSELSEAMEGLRKDLMDDKLPHRKMAEVELGDTLIRVLDIAGALGYDLGNATVEKDSYNSIRPDHKPGARMLAGGKAY